MVARFKQATDGVATIRDIRFQSFKQKIRVFLLVVLVAAGVGLFLASGGHSVPDNRPFKSILFLGNSRTYVNNLPSILQHMAEDGEAPFRYEIAMHALGGYTLEDHYSAPAVQDLTSSRKWDYVVLQGGSPENTNPMMRESFISHGHKLINMVHEQLSQPVLFVAWTYDSNAYDFENEHYLKPDYLAYAANYQAHIDQYGVPAHDKPAPETFFPLDIDKHFTFIQSDYQTLSAETNALMVNVGLAFKQLTDSMPHFSSLTSDGNHPSLQGSYLAAVMFHVCFSKVSAQSIRYIPPGLSQGDALAIRMFVDQFYPEGTCAGDNSDRSSQP